MSAEPSSSEKMRAAKRASSGPPTSAGQPRTPRILIVEDEVSLGRALLRWLRDYNVVHSASMSEALTRIRSGEPVDLIL